MNANKRFKRTKLAWHDKRQVKYDSYEHLGCLSAAPMERSVFLWCDVCRVKWIGCQDAAECPKCGSTKAYEEVTESNYE